MNETGSLCPTLKASEVIGDKWTLLLLRELFMGASRYSDFQRAVPTISPSVLSARLKTMEKNGLIIHKQSGIQKGGEYFLTPSAKELAPIIEALAKWGLRWARDKMSDINIDVGSFMWDFHRTLKTSALPEGQHVISVILTDQENVKQWWLICSGDVVDLCNQDLGHEVDLYITASLVLLAEIWMGDTALQSALKRGHIKISGLEYLHKSVEKWFPQSRYADIQPEK